MLGLVRDVLYVQLAIFSPCLEIRNLHQYIRQTLTQRFEDLSDYDRTYAILQQDSVTADTANNLVLCLKSSFGNGLISRELWTHTRVGTLIVATIYLKLIQNKYMFRSFTVLQCSRQHCLQPVASDVEVVGYL